MFIAMNRFNVIRGCEEAFEQVWLSRDSQLEKVRGFVEYYLLKGPEAEDHTLYAWDTVWQSRAAFEAWTKSGAFRNRTREGWRQQAALCWASAIRGIRNYPDGGSRQLSGRVTLAIGWSIPEIRKYAIRVDLTVPTVSVLALAADDAGVSGMVEKGHVWTAPGWQEESSLAALVGAAMCSA